MLAMVLCVQELGQMVAQFCMVSIHSLIHLLPQLVSGALGMLLPVKI